MPATDTIEMTVEELVDVVAVEVMGWEFTEGSMHQFAGWAIGTETIFITDEWEPQNRSPHWYMIVKRMREVGFGWVLSEEKPGTGELYAQFGKDDRVPRITTRLHENLGIAVMLAAYEAVTDKRVEVIDD